MIDQKYSKKIKIIALEMLQAHRNSRKRFTIIFFSPHMVGRRTVCFDSLDDVTQLTFDRTISFFFFAFRRDDFWSFNFQRHTSKFKDWSNSSNRSFKNDVKKVVHELPPYAPLTTHKLFFFGNKFGHSNFKWKHMFIPSISVTHLYF